MLEKNHCHLSNPEEDLVMDLNENEITAAYDFYAREQFDSLKVANKAMLNLAWGEIGDKELKSFTLAGLETKDQEKLEALEAKEIKKQSTKRKRLDVQKIRRQALAKKQKEAKEASSDAGPSGSNPSTQPRTPSPPPPNQLQCVGDNDRTPKGESEFAHLQHVVIKNI